MKTSTPAWRVLKDALQQPVAEKTHTYGSVYHQSGRTVTAVFLGQKTEGDQTGKPGTNNKQHLPHTLTPVSSDLIFFAA